MVVGHVGDTLVDIHRICGVYLRFTTVPNASGEYFARTGVPAQLDVYPRWCIAVTDYVDTSILYYGFFVVLGP